MNSLRFLTSFLFREAESAVKYINIILSIETPSGLIHKTNDCLKHNPTIVIGRRLNITFVKEYGGKKPWFLLVASEFQ